MCGFVDIDAPTMKEAMGYIPFPVDATYVDINFELSSEDPEILLMFTDEPELDEPAETEAVEGCPFCEGENVFQNWNTAKQGYIAQCQHCGEQIMLCDECMRTTIQEGAVTGMRKYMATKRGVSASAGLQSTKHTETNKANSFFL